MRNLKYFWKPSVLLLVSRYLGEQLHTNCVQKKFLRPLNIKNTKKIEIVQKWQFLTFAVFVAKFSNKKDFRLDKILSSSSKSNHFE